MGGEPPVAAPHRDRARSEAKGVIAHARPDGCGHADDPAGNDPAARGKSPEVDVTAEQGVGRGDREIHKRETDAPELHGRGIEPDRAADLDVPWPAGGL